MLEELAGGGSTALQIVVALALLLLGRRLYWVFVAGVGFVVTMVLTTEHLGFLDEWLMLALTVVAGIAGALLALLLQRFAVALAGFAAGVYIVHSIAGPIDVEPWLEALGLLISGIVGAVFASVLFDMALIVLSSITGAVLLADALALEQQPATILVLVATLVGLSVQVSMRRKDKEQDA